MFDALRRYREKRVLRTAALPDALWHEACAALPFLGRYAPDEVARLRDLVVLFLDAKGIVVMDRADGVDWRVKLEATAP